MDSPKTMPSAPIGDGRIKMMVPKSLAQRALKNTTHPEYLLHSLKMYVL